MSPIRHDAEIDKIIAAGDGHYRVSSHREALRAYLKAAGLGSSAALFRLGYMAENGLGAVAKMDAAERLYRRAAEMGDPNGEYFLGRFYVRRFRRDTRAVGLRYIRRAALKAYPPAFYALGTIYLSGEVVERNGAMAKACFEKAAHKGHLFARMWTARLRVSGGDGGSSRVAGAFEYLSVMIDAMRLLRRQGPFSPLLLD